MGFLLIPLNNRLCRVYVDVNKAHGHLDRSRAWPNTVAMQFDTASQAEWKRGWRVILGSMIASGFGVPLFYYVFSLFIVPMTEEFQTTRGALSNLQALIVVGALVAPIIGRLLDRLGFRRVFGFSMLGIIAAHLLMASLVSSLWQFALVALLYGMAGIGGGPLGYTRLINGWFWHSRGFALGVAALGLAVTAAILPSWLAGLIETSGWRAGFWVLAGLTAFISLPLTLMLVRNQPPEGLAGPTIEAAHHSDRSFMRTRDFWLLVIAMICMAVPGAGLLTQISPLVQEEGVAARTAAFGITAYALGQVAGRIIAGWFLDRANPRIVGFFFTMVPAIGLVMLAGFDLPSAAAIGAVALVGIQQGAEIDLFAYFTARRFGLAHYGAIYGWVIAAGWVGNAAGILLFGWLHDFAGNYSAAEAVGAVLMAIGAMTIFMVRISAVAPLAVVGAEPEVKGAAD
jgi:MFS family permease